METIEDIIRRISRDEIEKALVGLRQKPVIQYVDDRRLYSVASAAALIEVSRSYLYDRIKAGDIAVVELGHGTAKQRIAAPELQRFIDARTFGNRS